MDEICAHDIASDLVLNFEGGRRFLQVFVHLWADFYDKWSCQWCRYLCASNGNMQQRCKQDHRLLELTPKETHERQQRSKPLYKNLQWRFFQVKKRLQSKANSQLLSTEPLQPYSKKVRNEIEKGPLLFSMPNAEESNIPAL
jgi:hypothetical protein